MGGRKQPNSKISQCPAAKIKMGAKVAAAEHVRNAWDLNPFMAVHRVLVRHCWPAHQPFISLYFVVARSLPIQSAGFDPET